MYKSMLFFVSSYSSPLFLSSAKHTEVKENKKINSTVKNSNIVLNPTKKSSEIKPSITKKDMDKKTPIKQNEIKSSTKDDDEWESF